MPEFSFDVAGDVPLPDNPVALVAVASATTRRRTLPMAAASAGISATGKPAIRPIRCTCF